MSLFDVYDLTSDFSRLKMANPAFLRPVVHYAAGQAGQSRLQMFSMYNQHNIWMLLKPPQVLQPVTRRRTGSMYLCKGGNAFQKISSMFIQFNVCDSVKPRRYFPVHFWASSSRKSPTQPQIEQVVLAVKRRLYNSSSKKTNLVFIVFANVQFRCIRLLCSALVISYIFTSCSTEGSVLHSLSPCRLCSHHSEWICSHMSTQEGRGEEELKEQISKKTIKGAHALAETLQCISVRWL